MVIPRKRRGKRMKARRPSEPVTPRVQREDQRVERVWRERAIVACLWSNLSSRHQAGTLWARTLLHQRRSQQSRAVILRPQILKEGRKRRRRRTRNTRSIRSTRNTRPRRPPRMGRGLRKKRALKSWSGSCGRKLCDPCVLSWLPIPTVPVTMQHLATILANLVTDGDCARFYVKLLLSCACRHWYRKQCQWLHAQRLMSPEIL